MTREEYLQSVINLVRQIDVEGRGVKASSLGNLVRSFPTDWRALGYRKFTELLQDGVPSFSVQ